MAVEDWSILCRSGQLLSIKGEKISETVMLNTLKEVVDSMAGNAYDIVDFTSCGSIEIDELALDDGWCLHLTQLLPDSFLTVSC